MDLGRICPPLILWRYEQKTWDYWFDFTLAVFRAVTEFSPIRHYMSSQFVKDLFMLQWTLNGFLEAGSDQVRRRDIHIWLDPASDSVFETLQDWQTKGFVSIMADPRSCKEKEVCLKILKRIEAVPEPEDLNDA
jgi:hypothetical protein